MTPHELNMRAEEYYKAKEGEQKQSITLAYMTAYWQRVKKMPDLKKLLEGPPKPQTDEQMLEKIKQLNALFGGEIRGAQ